MAEALAKVKRELGRDAIILHTRTIKKGGMLGIGGHTFVEITATRDSNVLQTRNARDNIRPQSTGVRRSPAEAPALPVMSVPTAPSKPAQAEPDLRRDLYHLRSLVQEVLTESRRHHAPVVPDTLRDDYMRLIQSEVADELAHELLDRIQAETGEAGVHDNVLVRRQLRDFIASMVPATGPIVADKPKDRPRVVALVGPTGVGKTTTIAKLAAHFKLREHRRVGLITIDTYRIAAVDQLRVYAQIIDVPLEVAMTPADMVSALERLSHCDVVLVDTAGRGQNDQRRIEELKRYLEAVKPDEVHLVLACNTSQSVLLSAVRQFEPLGIDRLVFTKMDEAVGFGVVLNVIRQVDKKLSYITTGQDVPDDIEVGHGRRIAELILGTASLASRNMVGVRG